MWSIIDVVQLNYSELYAQPEPEECLLSPSPVFVGMYDNQSEAQREFVRYVARMPLIETRGAPTDPTTVLKSTIRETEWWEDYESIDFLAVAVKVNEGSVCQVHDLYGMIYDDEKKDRLAYLWSLSMDDLLTTVDIRTIQYIADIVHNFLRDSGVDVPDNGNSTIHRPHLIETPLPGLPLPLVPIEFVAMEHLLNMPDGLPEGISYGGHGPCGIME